MIGEPSMVTKTEAIAAAGEVLATARRTAAAMTVEEQARAAYTPTGPSIPELERRIRARRAETVRRAAIAAAPVSEPLPVPPLVRRHHSAVVAMRDDASFSLSGEPRRRALLIAETLVREAVRRKWAVTVGGGRSAHGGGVGGLRSPQLILAEGVDSAQVWFAQPQLRSETPAGRRDAPPTKPFTPSNRLVVRARTTLSYSVKEWRDTRSRGLEESVGDVVEWVVGKLAQQAEKRADWEAGAPAREAARLAEIDRMRAQLAAQRHEAALASEVDRWRRATDVRGYLAAVRERRVPGETDPAKLAELQAWLVAGDALADRLDPLGPLT